MYVAVTCTLFSLCCHSSMLNWAWGSFCSWGSCGIYSTFEHKKSILFAAAYKITVHERVVVTLSSGEAIGFIGLCWHHHHACYHNQFHWGKNCQRCLPLCSSRISLSLSLVYTSSFDFLFVWLYNICILEINGKMTVHFKLQLAGPAHE